MRPLMVPQPVTTPSPGITILPISKSVARWVTNMSYSSNESGSSNTSRRSRAVSLPFLCCASIRCWPPPRRAAARRSSSAGMIFCMCLPNPLGRTSLTDRSNLGWGGEGKNANGMWDARYYSRVPLRHLPSRIDDYPPPHAASQDAIGAGGKVGETCLAHPVGIGAGRKQRGQSIPGSNPRRVWLHHAVDAEQRYAAQDERQHAPREINAPGIADGCYRTAPPKLFQQLGQHRSTDTVDGARPLLLVEALARLGHYGVAAHNTRRPELAQRVGQFRPA